MKKYKHIPTEEIWKETPNNKFLYQDMSVTALIPIKLIENSKDWEEVKEKEYEILSFIDTSNNNIFDDISKGNSAGRLMYYSKTSNTWVASIHKDIIIHSVKRLSDGEVFTVGDNTSYGIISRFDIQDTTWMGVVAIFTDNSVMALGFLVKKSKQPLFTTEDGVDVFKEDDIYFVDVNFTVTKHNNISEITVRLYKNLANNPLCKWFSTKEAAEEYILMNKSCLSVMDYIKSMGKFSSVNTKNPDQWLVPENSPICLKLKALVKERINKV